MSRKRGILKQTDSERGGASLCFLSLVKHLRDMYNGLLNMMAYGTGSTNGIVCLASSKNLAMFRVEALGIFGNIRRCIEMIVGKRGIAQFLNHCNQSYPSRQAIQ